MSLLLALACAALPVQEREPLREVLAFPLSPRLELWFEARTGAGEGTSTPVRRRALALAACFASPHLAQLADARVLAAPPGTTLDEVFAGPWPLPERALAEGVDVDTARRAAAALGAELERRRETFVATDWPARERALAEARDALAALLPPDAQRAIAADAADALGLDAPREPVAVHLVTRMPPPGGVTLRTSRGAAECVVAVAGREPSLLAEVVVHEALHALVARQRVPADLFDAIDTRLHVAGAADGRWRRSAVHTLYFLAAADFVRAHVDSEHVPYGESEGVYDRSRALVDAAAPLWRRYRAGELDAAAFAEALVAAWVPLYDARDR